MYNVVNAVQRSALWRIKHCVQSSVVSNIVPLLVSKKKVGVRKWSIRPSLISTLQCLACQSPHLPKDPQCPCVGVDSASVLSEWEWVASQISTSHQLFHSLLPLLSTALVTAQDPIALPPTNTHSAFCWIVLEWGGGFAYEWDIAWFAYEWAVDTAYLSGSAGPR